LILVVTVRSVGGGQRFLRERLDHGIEGRVYLAETAEGRFNGFATGNLARPDRRRRC
jgi:hypothetical protein